MLANFFSVGNILFISYFFLIFSIILGVQAGKERLARASNQFDAT